MGILEFHFHECKFSPSMNVGGDEETAESSSDTEDNEDSPTGLGDESTGEGGGSARSGIGAIVALAALVALGALVKWKRGGSGEVDDEGDEELTSQDVEVSA